MKSIKQVLWILALCTSSLFFSKNANAQCSSFNVTASKTADGANLGDVTVTASITGGGGVRTWYTWYTSSYSFISSGSTKANLNAGSYCVIARDSNITANCTDTFCLTVTDTGAFNCANMVSSLTEVDLCQLNDIKLSTWVSGGSGNYSYKWSTSSSDTQSSLVNKTFGTYSVTITDKIHGCKDTLYKSVVDDTCNICDSFNNVGNISEGDGCNMNDIKLTPNIWRGSSTYSFFWNNGDTNRILTGKSTGNYSLIITDLVSGCKDTLYKTVVDDTCNPCQNFQAWISKQDPCSKNDITLKAYPNNWWNGRHTFLWNTGSTDSNLYNRGSGSYWVKVTDSITGCIDTAFITVVDDTCNVCDNYTNNGYIIENDSCQKNDIILSAQKWGGSNSFFYKWSTGETTQLITNKTTGSYSVIITDTLYGCMDTLYITVADDTCSPCQYFQAWVYENDSCQKNDIALTAYPQDSLGTTRYKYLWNTGATFMSLTNRGAGTYWVKVTDSILGCIDTAYITVADDTCNPCDNFGGYMYKHDSCQSNDLKIYAYAYGGSGNYSYVWNTGSTASFLTNRGTGWYKVTITDVTNGCIYKDSIYAVDSNFKCCRAWFYTNDSAVASTKTFYGQNSMYDSTAGSTTYSWNFGDGNTGSGQTKNHTYTSSGNKTVCLYISTASGCKDTFCSVVNSPAPGKNLKVSHYGIPYIKDTNRYTYITYQNIGTTTENGIVEYKYPAGMTLVSSTVSPLTHIGNKISFSVGSLAPGASGTIYLEMKTPMSFTLGSIKCDTAIILPISGDIVPSNNTSYECDSVVASYDPNDKTPNPKGIGAEGAISPDTKEIGYLIRFENEGNWRTYRVRVEDEIDPSFDINSVMIGDVSHAFRLVRNGSKLIWYFDNIELTPKSVDPNRSHGYIQYTLQLKSGLALGTQLKNTAYIYFDANPAIITNTTKNTLKNADGTASASRLESDEMLDFDLKRNGDKLTVFSPSKMQALRIFDISGKLQIEKELHSDREEIENILLSQGIYIVHVDIDNQTVIKKIKF